jgi:hypothetical protein
MKGLSVVEMIKLLLPVCWFSTAVTFNGCHVVLCIVGNEDSMRTMYVMFVLA